MVYVVNNSIFVLAFLCLLVSLLLAHRKMFRVPVWVSLPVLLLILAVGWSALTSWAIKNARQKAIDEGRIEGPP